MKSNLKKQNIIKDLALILVVFGLIALFIAKSDKYIQITLQAILIWAAKVLPSLLPFFFLTALLTKSGAIYKIFPKLKKISRFLYNADGIALYIQLMSFLSGYPVGAKIICDLYKSRIISDKQAEKYSLFTSTSGPSFIVGAVGIAMFNDKKIGLIILISHLSGSILNGILFRNLNDNRPIAPLINYTKAQNILYEANYSAIFSVLICGGFIIIFYLAAEMASDLYLLYPLQKLLGYFLEPAIADGIVNGIFECTKGAMILSGAVNQRLAICFATGIISFGGISVLVQSIAYLKTTGVRVLVFAASKVIHSVTSFLFCYILLLWL